MEASVCRPGRCTFMGMRNHPHFSYLKEILFKMESYDLIKYKFEMGVYSLEQMCEFVEQNLITEKDFHYITSYNYQGIKKCGIN